MLVDQYGKEIKSGRPITDEIAVSSVRDRYQSYPSHGLTPDTLTTILKEADQGNIYRQAELFEEMEEKDTHLASTLQTRKLAVVGLNWEVLPASESAEDKKIAAEAKEMIEYIDNWELGLLDILDAIGKGFSVSEIMWQIAEGRVWIGSLKWLHQKRFTFSGPLTKIGQHTTSPLLDVPRLITDEQQVYGEELLPMKFVFHRHKARSGATPRGGLCRPCTYMYLFKNYDIKDWLVFNELYSVPMRLGKYKPGATQDEISKLKSAVFNLGVDAAAVVSDSTIIELLESKVRGETHAFKDLAEFCDRAMSKAVLGHTGSSESTPGKLGSEDSANEVRQDLIEADAKALIRTIKSQILAPWVVYNYGPVAGVPKFVLHYEAGEDIEKTARTYGILVKDVNFKGISVNHIRERFGIPEPEPDEETVSAVQQGLGIGDQGLATTPSSPAEDETAPEEVGKRLQTTQATVLNGAQVTAATAIVIAVAAGQIPRNAGIGQLMVLFNLTNAQAEQVMGSAGTKTPTIANPRPDLTEEQKNKGEKDSGQAGMTNIKEDQQDIEDLADNALMQAGIVLTPIQQIIDASTSYEDMQKRIKAAYGTVDLTTFRKIMERAMFMADLKGRSIDG